MLPPMRSLLVVLPLGGVCRGAVGVLQSAPADQQTECSEVASLSLPNTKVTAASEVVPGAFAPPGGGGGAAFAKLPAFCRVAATLTPSSDSDIKIEVWLPLTGWNGKLQSVGNGAWQGSIGYAAMAEALGRGYATASTDTGHVGGSASFGMGHPEKVIDFAYRSEHEMTVAAKAIINRMYGSAPKYSVLERLLGGRPPGDERGADVSGRLRRDHRRLARSRLVGTHGAGRPDRAGTTAARGAAVERAAAAPARGRGLSLRRQRRREGRVDRESGRAACSIPGCSQCEGRAGADCLTPAQVETVRTIYSPLVEPKTKREIPGLAAGSELGWTDMGWTASARTTGLDHFRFLIFADPTWDVQKFNAATDVARLTEARAEPSTPAIPI